MDQDIQALIVNVINPATGKGLLLEKRLVSIEQKGDQVVLTYRRDGITATQKREIEDQIYQALSEKFKPENIAVKTVSEEGNSSVSAEKPAEIKAGHTPAQSKKRVNEVKKVIAVSSCKGGVGKSTVTVNLALSLLKQGKKVGILDADIYGPSIPTMLNMRQAKPQSNGEKKILPIDAHGIKFISFGLFVPEKDPVIWRGPMLGGVLNQFLFDVAWGDLDYLLIDLPPGTGDMQLSLVQLTDIDGVIVVSTPQEVALLDTVKGLKMFEQLKVPIIGLVENMSYFVPDDADKRYYIFGQGGVSRMAKELNIPFLGEVPLEMGLREASDIGIPFMAQNKFDGRPAWKGYMEVSKKLDTILSDKKAGFFSGLFR
jgi:ATP-binding protein involved in chromosome partitioning